MPQATLALRTLQSTALTPRLQQSVRLLQLSSTDFAREVDEALATNPFLDHRHAGLHDSSTSSEASLPPTGVDADGKAAVDSAFEVPGASDDHLRVESSDADPMEIANVRGIDGRVFDGSQPDALSGVEARSTLRMHLHDELRGYRLGERDRTIAELVIEAIDDDGYIRQDLSEVANHFAFEPPVSTDELDIALTLVQQLGPAGVASRGVAECLALQLEAGATRLASEPKGAPIVTLALAIVRDHLDLMAARDWPAIHRRLGAAPADVARAVELIRRLDPRPGSAFGDEVARTVVPDVIVRRGRDGWAADINPAVIPKFSLNRVYVALFNDSLVGERQPLGQQLQEARWLVRNAAQRFVTIRRVARAIIAEQGAFLEYGDIAIRPLLLRQVADTLELHESTVSRAIGNKFMATPRGVFAFKHFFSRKLATVSGGTCSATSIRAAMRELIDREDRAEPMSDVVLAKALTDQGLCVARRTVTKYRGMMSIPPVEMRRAFA